jgi:hypothetical protein
MSRDELESLYRASPPAPVLDGYYPGRSVKMPRCSSLIWKGKEFRCGEVIINHWCMGIVAVQANVCLGESWLDGNPSFIMDYRGSSRMIWRNSRDELREVAPGLYLGIMYKEGKCEPKFATFFVLEACEH